MTDARNNILAVIGKTAAKTEQRRSLRKAKGNATGYLTVWNDAVSESFPGHAVAPTIETLALLKRALKRLGGMDVKRNTEFLEWSVRNWVLIGETKFTDRKGRSNFPTEPVLRYFVVAIERFYSAYCAKDTRPLKSANADQNAKKLERSEASLVAANAEIARLTKLLNKANDTIKRKDQELRRLSGGTGSGEFTRWD